MDLGLTGRTALVCGASKGLGLGCAQALVQEGVNVVIVARGEAALQDAAKHLRSVASQQAWVQEVAADITTEAGRAAVFALGHDFDIVVTNAGGPPPGDFRDWSQDDWLKAVNANMLTPIALMQHTVDGMAKRGFGRIINITSSAVKAPIDVLGLSNGARSGLTGFVAGLARSSIASCGVTINNVLPGQFDTDRLRGNAAIASQKSSKSVEAIQAANRQKIPMQRFGTPAEFGAVCAFLCSEHAAFMTGQNILLDGGAYAGTF